MSEVEWSEEERPAKKKGIPKWVWFGCGGGCLLTLLIAVLGVVLLVRTAKDAMDPEKQWPKLAKILPYDERPTGLELEMGMNVFGQAETYVFRDMTQNLVVSVVRVNEDGAAEFDNLFAEGEMSSLFGFGQPRNAETQEMELQARLIRVLHFDSVKGDPNQGAGAWVDLSAPGLARYVNFRRMSSSRELIPNESLASFFEPFDVWRDF